MQAITAPGTVLENTRGIVHYLPASDETSPNIDVVYAEFGYKFYEEISGLKSPKEGIQSIIVTAVNDPPISTANSMIVQPSDDGSVEPVVYLDER